MNAEKREPSCNCIEKAEAFLKDRNTELDLFLSLDGTQPDRVVIQTAIIEKKRGAKAMRMVPNYCPFCGVRYGWKDTPPAPLTGGSDGEVDSEVASPSRLTADGSSIVHPSSVSARPPVEAGQ